MSETFKVSRKRMVDLLNEDLSREYHAVIAYTIYSQTIKGAAFNNMAAELEGHALEELRFALVWREIRGGQNLRPNLVLSDTAMSRRGGFGLLGAGYRL